MKKEIVQTIISTVLAAFIIFIVSKSFGLYEKTISDSQTQEIARLIVDNEIYRNVLIGKMESSKKFIGPKGDQGPEGGQGPPGKSDQDMGTILSMIIVKNKEIVRCTNGVLYDSKSGVVTFPNPNKSNYISFITDYGPTYITTTHYLRSDFEAINKFKVWKKALNTEGANKASAPSSFCAMAIAFK